MLTKDFVLAGQAVFTVTNPVGEYYTYRVDRVADEGKPARYFAKLLTGPDNTSDYTYLGMVDEITSRVVLTRASRYTADSRPYRVLDWALSKVWECKELPAGYSLRHIGRCGRCGRPLTTPDSLDIGLGPICRDAE